MIRIFVVVGTVGLAVIVYLATVAVGPITQLPPSESLLTGFRAKGFVPKNVNLEEDESAEEAEVFEVPEQDGVMLKEILAKGGSMPGMNMPGMKMDDADKPAMKMKLNADGTMAVDADGKMIMEPAGDAPMKMDGDGKTAMKTDGAEKPAMKMKLNPDGTMAVGADGKMIMEPAGDAPMKMDGDMDMGEGGILVKDDGTFDREISLEMAEWKFSKMQIDVKMGEKIKFTIRNGGQIPHEFMFMDMPLMSAVNYRATRADWNLVEHEALFEKSLVLPGGEFSFVLKVTRPGAWMFMCMLPYHMQMGMMGQMATEGMAMDMNMAM